METSRTRRNIIRMSAIAAAAVAARVTTKAEANPGNGNGWGQGEGGGKGHGSCLLAGTRVQTTSGERRIEELQVGDRLATMFGGERAITWIDSYQKMGDPRNPPVWIARSALGPDVPRVDLCMTGLHAVLIDGILIPVGGLVNGVTIRQVEVQDRAFYHLRFEAHDVFFAEGAPVESLPEVDEVSCAPRAPIGRYEFQSRFRSAISPWIDVRQPVEVIRDRFEERLAKAA